ncbi:MAG: AIPR family protein [Sphingobacteriales bacterium]|nr:AIPR family protein [Sphingobacteriales bacterium]
MKKKELAVAKIKAFRVKSGVETSDENIIAAIHLMNSHGLDQDAAKDQASRSANDNGIDAWYFDEDDCSLYIYQSKLSESKGLVLKGLVDLERAADWLTKILVDGSLDKPPVDNHMLYGLFVNISKNRGKLKLIRFVLLSLFDENELEDEECIDDFNSTIAKTTLNKYVTQRLKGRLCLAIEQFCFESTIPKSIKTYEIHKFQESSVFLRKKASLHLSYVSLYSLVELYRQRGDVLFDKNVRLSLFNTKEAKDRLVHPLFETLDMIIEGRLKPEIFPFYHVGITIAASNVEDTNDNIFNLESPGVINGCQTITIAHEYLKKLSQIKNEEDRNIKIEMFRKIQVIAKVVIGVTEDELKEITNANNRQNPIENWQLFSNEGVHISIEAALKDIGVFYERQKGKFDAIMKVTDNAKYYPHTNGTYITVTLLGQIVALARGELQMAAKPALIFENKTNHDLIFTKSVYNKPEDIVLLFNIYKSMLRAYKNYLNIPTHAENSYTQRIFSKPIVRIHILYLGLIFYYQSVRAQSVREDYGTNLLKVASSNLNGHMESSFYQRVITKFRDWYLAESKRLEVEVSNKKLFAFISTLCTDFGVDFDENTPFENS